MAPHRYSQQRERIYQTVMASRRHPTAQMVYDALQPELPQLSLGTVYRNLRQLAQAGYLRELEGPVSRFDGDLRPHSHIRCIHCGAVADVPVPYDPELDRPGMVEDWKVRDHELMFNGICPACAGKSPQ